MSILIDTCAIHCVFDVDKQKHLEYKPIAKWLFNGPGKIVYGGEKYIKELKKAIGPYLEIYAELYKSGKIIRLNDKEVDIIQKKVEQIKKHKDFDDPHLIAIVITSDVRLVCTTEKRAIPFIKSKELYFNGIKPPKIYSFKNHKILLGKKYHPTPKHVEAGIHFL